MQKYAYEAIEREQDLPLKVFSVSIDHSAFHWHYDYELMAVLKGSLAVWHGTERLVMKRGDILLINGKTVHALSRTAEENLCLFLQIPPALFASEKERGRTYRFQLSSASGEYPPEGGYSRFLRSALRIGLSVPTEDFPSRCRVLSELYGLIADLFDYTVHDFSQAPSGQSAPADEGLLEKILSLVEENDVYEDAVRRICQQAGLSSKTMYRFLKTSIGSTASDLVRLSRLEKAKLMLRRSEIPVSVISDRCGFGSEACFYRIFKKEVGATPSEYRVSVLPQGEDSQIRGYLPTSGSDARRLMLALLSEL